MQVVLFKCIIIFFTFCINLFDVNGLVELTPVNDNVIVTTEAAVRDTVNKLFHIFKLNQINNKPKFKQYFMVHNSLVAMMLQDNENLKSIVKLARIDNNIDNATVNFMGVINELLNGEENNPNLNENVMDEYVIKLIDNFLSELKSLKEKFGVVSRAKLDINDELVKILTEDDNSNINVTSGKDSNISNDTESNDVLRENEFWQPSGRRIYRGDRTKIKYFPFMASIQIFHRFQCSGSIVKSDLIITAASCLQLAWNNRFFRENPAFLSVRVGSSFHNGGGEVIPVLEVYFHPNYNPKNLRHNLCMLRLIRHLSLKRKVRRVKIDFDRNPWGLPETTDGITVLGWGAKGASNIKHETLQSQLAFTVLDFYPLSDCAEIYSREYVTRNHFCAGFFSKGGGACNRDVGGPGIVEGLLTGVVSFGSPLCGTPNAPTVFTKLGYYVDWIEEIMEQVVPHMKKHTTLIPITYSAKTLPISPFTMPPLMATQSTPPSPIVEMDVLRLLKDEELFREFLETMFENKEDGSYDDTDSDKKEETIKPAQPVKKKDKTTTSEAAEYATKIFNFESVVTKSYSENKFTILDPNLSEIAENDLERDIARLVDGIDIQKVVDDVADDVSTDTESAMPIEDSRESTENEQKDYFKLDTVLDLPKPNNANDYSKPLLINHSKGNDLKRNDSVLTLLYISDNEKKTAKTLQKDKNNDEVGDGISIDADSFKDLTFRQDVQKALYNFLPKEELYKLLAGTIGSETENK